MPSLPVVIIGAGISGLSCAYYLSRLSSHVLKPNNIVILEASSQTGGWLKSRRFNDGVIHELGPRSVRTAGCLGLNTIRLLEDLELCDEVIGVSSKSAAGQKRYILLNGNLIKLPSSFMDLLTVRHPFTKPLIKMMLNDLMGSKFNVDSDVSVYDFIHQRLGTEVADFIADPLCRGITAGNARNLSFKSMFPDIFARTIEKGSLVKGMLMSKKSIFPIELVPQESDFSRKVKENRFISWSLKRGIQALPETLTEYLDEKGVHFFTSTAVERIGIENDKPLLHLSSGTVLRARAIFSTVPAYALATCLDDVSQKIAQKLSGIPFVDVAVACLEFNVLGITYDSCCFPEHDGGKDITRVTCMMGGEWFDDLFRFSSNEEILNGAIETAKKVLKFSSDPLRTTLAIHKNCIPQYRLNHSDNVEGLRRSFSTLFPHFYLLGTSFNGVGVNDVIFAAKKAVYDFSNSCTE